MTTPPLCRVLRRNSPLCVPPQWLSPRADSDSPSPWTHLSLAASVCFNQLIRPFEFQLQQIGSQKLHTNSFRIQIQWTWKLVGDVRMCHLKKNRRIPHGREVFASKPGSHLHFLEFGTAPPALAAGCLPCHSPTASECSTAHLQDSLNLATIPKNTGTYLTPILQCGVFWVFFQYLFDATIFWGLPCF